MRKANSLIKLFNLNLSLRNMLISVREIREHFLIHYSYNNQKIIITKSQVLLSIKYYINSRNPIYQTLLTASTKASSTINISRLCLQ